MLEPTWLANAEYVARRLQRRSVGRFIGRVRHGEDHVDDRLRRKAGHGGGTRVLEDFHAGTEALSGALLFSRGRLKLLAMAALHVDIWSDIVCPWCYVGKRRLEAAL